MWKFVLVNVLEVLMELNSWWSINAFKSTTRDTYGAYLKKFNSYTKMNLLLLSRLNHPKQILKQLCSMITKDLFDVTKTTKLM